MTSKERLLSNIHSATCNEHIFNAVEQYNESSEIYKSIEHQFRYLILLNKDKDDKITLAQKVCLFMDKSEALHFYERKVEELIHEDFSQFFTLNIIDLQTSLSISKYINS